MYYYHIPIPVLIVDTLMYFSHSFYVYCNLICVVCLYSSVRLYCVFHVSVLLCYFALFVIAVSVAVMVLWVVLNWRASFSHSVMCSWQRLRVLCRLQSSFICSCVFVCRARGHGVPAFFLFPSPLTGRSPPAVLTAASALFSPGAGRTAPGAEQGEINVIVNRISNGRTNI